MNEDPIVEEVRRVRDKLAGRLNYDIHAIFADMRAREGLENEEHPLVKDANERAESRGNSLALNDKPPRKP